MYFPLRVFFFQEPVANSFIVLGEVQSAGGGGECSGLSFGVWAIRSAKPVQVVGDDDEGDDDGDSSSDGGPTGKVDEDGKGVPLNGRESRIIMGDK